MKSFIIMIILLFSAKTLLAQKSGKSSSKKFVILQSHHHLSAYSVGIFKIKRPFISFPAGGYKKTGPEISIDLYEDNKPATLGNNIDFFNPVLIEHIVPGEGDVVLCDFSAGIFNLQLEVLENKISNFRLLLDTKVFLLPSLLICFEPGEPSLLKTGFAVLLK